jgi:hypothetical protein
MQHVLWQHVFGNMLAGVCLRATTPDSADPGRYPGLGVVADYVQSAMGEVLAELIGVPPYFLAQARRGRPAYSSSSSSAAARRRRGACGACVHAARTRRDRKW